MTMIYKDSKNISTEEALITVDDAQMRVESVVDDLNQLAADLRDLLPHGPGADVARPVGDLTQRLRAVAVVWADRIRRQIMAHGLPVDEVACTKCDSADFSNQDCEACSAVRSDGLALARRLGGWTV